LKHRDANSFSHRGCRSAKDRAWLTTNRAVAQISSITVGMAYAIHEVRHSNQSKQAAQKEYPATVPEDDIDPCDTVALRLPRTGASGTLTY
jgi:hypothetical protein